MSVGRQSTASARTPPRWHWIYYVLAAFDVFTVSMSLYLNHQITNIHIRSVETNQVWARLLQGFSALDELVAAVNAPGNDVFETHNVAAESARMKSALTEFYQRLHSLRQELEEQAGAERGQPLLRDLDALAETTVSMAADAEAIFSSLSRDRSEEAGKRMATMDRKYGRANTALDQLRSRVGVIQKEDFDQQTAAADSLRRFEYAIAALILIMVAGATLYGHNLAKQVQAASLQREQFLEQEQVAKVRALLLQEFLAAQEVERRRIARDLHDEIGQSLTSVLIGLRNVENAPTPAEGRERIGELRQITAQTLEEVRRLAWGLRPSVLDDLGLVAALDRYIQDYAKTHGTLTRLDAGDFASNRLPEPVETALYRIVQEALTNTAKHARANSALISLARKADTVELCIQDDGCGLQRPARLQRDDRKFHLGLTGMRERATLLGGSLTIESRPGQGTKISVHIPLSECAHD